MRKHVFQIDDRGEFYWWIAETHAEATKRHTDYMKEVGDEDSDLRSSEVLPDNRKLISYYANSIAHLLGPFEQGVRERDSLPSSRILG